MKKQITRIRTESSIESILAMGPSLQGITKSSESDANIEISADRVFREAVELLPGASWVGEQLSSVDKYFDLSNHQEDSWGEENLEWKAYIQGCAHLNSYNSFHIIDLYRRATGTEWVDQDFELITPSVPESQLPEEMYASGNLRVSICLATLSSDNIMRILDGISQCQTPTTVYLCGGLADRKKSTLLVSGWGHKVKMVDYCGRQSLSALALTIREADINICGPGKTALLSSGYGTFTICLDETGNPLFYPYGHGHLIVRSTDSAVFANSLTNLTREIIGFAVNGNGGSIPSIEQWGQFADDRLDEFLSKIELFVTQRVAQVGEQGQKSLLKLKPLIFMGLDIKQLMGDFYLTAFERTLTGTSGVSEFPVLQLDVIPQLSKLLVPMEKLFELAHFGAIYSKQTRISLENGNIAAAKKDSDKVQEVETMILEMGKAFPEFEAVCLFHTKRQNLMWNTNPEELALEMEALFEQFKTVLLVLLELSQGTFKEHLDKQSSSTGTLETSQGELNV